MLLQRLFGKPQKFWLNENTKLTVSGLKNLLVTSSVAMLAVLPAARSPVCPRVGSLSSTASLTWPWPLWTLTSIVTLRLDALECVLKWSNENLAAFIVGNFRLLDQWNGGCQSFNGTCVFTGCCIAYSTSYSGTTDSSVTSHDLFKLCFTYRWLGVCLRNFKTWPRHLVWATNWPHRWSLTLLIEMWWSVAHVLLHWWTLIHIVLVEERGVDVRSWTLIYRRHLRRTSRHIHSRLWIEVTRMHWRAIPVRSGTSRWHIHAHRSLVHRSHVWIHVHRRSIWAHSVRPIWTHLSSWWTVPVVLEAGRHLLVHGRTVRMIHERWSIARHSIHGVHLIIHHRIRSTHHRIGIHHSLLVHILWRHSRIHATHSSHSWLLRIWRNWWCWTSLLLALKLVQCLFSRQSNNRILSIQFLLRQVFHHDAHACFGSKRDDTKPFRLTISSVFEEFNFLKVTNSNTDGGIGDVLIGCPLLKRKCCRKIHRCNIIK